MDTNRSKYTAQWFYSKIFKDETIRPRPAQSAPKLPALLRTARSLEPSLGISWQSRESVFLKQAKLLAAYEDDFPFEGEVVRYYPTYQALTDQELRGYFTWRTRLRAGDWHKTSLSFAFLYIYELLNQVGLEDPMEGYRKLVAFRDTYGQLDPRVLPYLKTWLVDYVVYYNLDPALLGDTPQVVFDRCLTILDNIGCQSQEKVMFAVKTLSPKWLERSKFYNAYREDMDTVVTRVLGKISEHYAARCIRSMVEQYFGVAGEFQVRLFDAAVFLDRQKKRSCEYVLDERCVYRCVNGLWTVKKTPCPHSPNSKLSDLLKTVDSLMREAYAYPHPIQCPLDTKWILKLIRREIQALLDQKKAQEAKRVTIDFSRLAGIRRDAAITQEKLTVEEELEEAAPAAPPEPSPAPVSAAEPPEDCLLPPAEYRLLQCLLYGRDLGWIQQEGLMLSVLVDSINEILYDTFLDSVLDDSPQLLDDYIDELKEMVHP